MNSLGYEYVSEIIRYYVAKGRVEIVLKQLTLRFGPLSEAVKTRIRGAPDAQLDAVAERVLSVKTLEEALAPLS
jgi:hypothetical protein